MKKLYAQLAAGEITREEADVIRHDRVVQLLDQVRSLAVAVLIAFVVLGTVSTGAFVWLRSETRNERQQNLIAICDLYHQVAITAPPALNCRP